MTTFPTSNPNRTNSNNDSVTTCDSVPRVAINISGTLSLRLVC
jgi:hypothetical protein